MAVRAIRRRLQAGSNKMSPVTAALPATPRRGSSTNAIAAPRKAPLKKINAAPINPRTAYATPGKHMAPPSGA